tara:strand:+ start:566 stop:1087 length:522 start_codon:yes stop_codon:yes gene_type:complete
MPKTKTQKQNILSEIVDNLKKQQSVLFIDYKGIGVKDLSQLRKQLKEVGARLEVAKKTLLSRALAEQGIVADLKNMEGQVAVVYSFQDPIAGVKTAHAFARKNEHIKLLLGYMDNQLLTQAQVMELAQLPSREQLLAQFVGTLAAPMQGLVRVMEGNLKGLIIALSAIQEKKA